MIQNKNDLKKLISNYRIRVLTDPNCSELDRKIFIDNWKKLNQVNTLTKLVNKD